MKFVFKDQKLEMSSLKLNIFNTYEYMYVIMMPTIFTPVPH